MARNNKMSPAVKLLLPALKADYEAHSREPWVHFYCPVLLLDEPGVDLCEGHIVNKAFAESSSKVVVQRADVDNWYGSMFESDFTSLRHKNSISPEEYLTNSQLWNQLRPEFIIHGKSVECYFPGNQVPPTHTEIRFKLSNGLEKRIALKMPPGQCSEDDFSQAYMLVEKKVHIAAVVSLLKAAHLTLFRVLGYQYALGACGYRIAKLLGDFYRHNNEKSRSEVLEAAKGYFLNCANLVRPLTGGSLKGSIEDRMFQIVSTGGTRWGLIVFIRTNELVSGVMMPLYSCEKACVFFERFYERAFEHFDGLPALYDSKSWKIPSITPLRQEWPPIIGHPFE